uniref:Transmembrane protein 138 n=3 Tax=Macrostomum lignano TaxID=282301 RepID=A0A1I8G130_9PLAT
MLARYQFTFLLLALLLLFDVFVNSAVDYMATSNVNLLVLYILQDLFILFAFILIFLQFFSTYFFKAGLAKVLIDRFKLTIIFTVIYFGLTIGLHIWNLTLRWESISNIPTTAGYSALFAIQRGFSVFYYYIYKRSLLRLGDERFYKDSAFFRREFERRRND